MYKGRVRVYTTIPLSFSLSLLIWFYLLTRERANDVSDTVRDTHINFTNSLSLSSSFFHNLALSMYPSHWKPLPPSTPLALDPSYFLIHTHTLSLNHTHSLTHTLNLTPTIQTASGIQAARLEPLLFGFASSRLHLSLFKSPP